MQLTQKHFQFIAKTLAGISSDATWTNVVEAFALELAATNPKFKRDLFLEECGLEVEKDFQVVRDGSMALLYPNSFDAKAWVGNHIPEDAPWLGSAVGVEIRYIAEIVAGIKGDGFTVEERY